jgi:hypothetical protein
MISCYLLKSPEERVLSKYFCFQSDLKPGKCSKPSISAQKPIPGTYNSSFLTFLTRILSVIAQMVSCHLLKCSQEGVLSTYFCFQSDLRPGKCSKPTISAQKPIQNDQNRAVGAKNRAVRLRVLFLFAHIPCSLCLITSTRCYMPYKCQKRPKNSYLGSFGLIWAHCLYPNQKQPG